MQQVRALDTRGLQNDGGEEKRRRLQLRTVFTEKGKLKNRGAFAPLFFYVRTFAERHKSRSIRVRRLGLCVSVWHGK